MATVIQIKRTVGGNLPTHNNGTLSAGEMAYVYDTNDASPGNGGAGKKLYIGHRGGSGTESPHVIGGEYFTNMLDHANGTLTANSAILTDANKKVDNLKVDVMDFDGSTITTESGNGLTLNPATSVSIKGAYTLPTTDGTVGQAIMTDGSGAATFQTIGTNLTIKGDASTTDSIALLSDTLEIEGDAATGIATAVGANKITVSGTNASTTAKGVAKFAAADFAVSAEGEVTLNQTALEESVEDYVDGLIVGGTGISSTYVDEPGSGGATLTISGTDATTTAKGVASFATADFAVTAGAVTIKSSGVTNTQLAGAIANGKLTNSTITLSDGSATNAVDLGDTLTVSGGEGIDTSVSGDTLTISGELATTSNKGVASFDSSDFDVTGGVVTIKSTGITSSQIADDQVITSKILNANVTNAKLANPTTTLGTSTLTLGAATTDITGITSLDVDNINVNLNTISSTDTNGNIVISPNGTGVVDLNSHKITGLSSPSSVSDGANKQYVDGVAQGLSIKNAIKFATTGTLATLSGGTVTYDNTAGTLTLSVALTALDGINLTSSDHGTRVLVKDETGSTAEEAKNGIYVLTSLSLLTRAADANASAEVTAGTFFFVQSGNTNGDNGFVQTEIVNTIGTDALKYTQFSGAGQIIAGNGITKSGNELSVTVNTSTGGLGVESGSGLKIANAGVTNAMLAGSIANAKLSNSSVTINSQSLALGASLTLNADNIAEASSPTNQYFTNTRARSAVSIGAGTGLAYVSSTGVISGVDATVTTKGVASFDTANFTVTSGAVSVTQLDGGTYGS